MNLGTGMEGAPARVKHFSLDCKASTFIYINGGGKKRAKIV